MNLVETLVVFAGIPLAIYLAVSLFTLRSRLASAPRYRPGQPWDYEPMWFTASPEGVGRTHRERADDTTTAIRTARGGARGTW